VTLPADTDVLVVGGGPAGLATAEAAAAAGVRALVVEREPEIGEPVHTSGGMSVAAVRAFGIPPDLHHPVEEIRIVSPGESVSFRYPEPIVSLLDVRGTYRFLAERAARAGARVVTAADARTPLREGGRLAGWTVEAGGRSHDVHAPVVVDASGYRAAVAKAAGLHAGFRRFGVGAELELAAPALDETAGVLVVGSRYAPAGYAWAFPCGRGRVRVGVGVHHADVRSDPRRHLDLLVRDAASLGFDLEGATVEEEHFGLIPTDGPLAALAGDGIMAVGDAAGQATLVLGEGIRLGLLAGGLAGTVAAHAVEAGRRDRDALLPYERAFRRRHGRDLRIGGILNRRLARADDAAWDRHVRILQTLPPRLLPSLLQSEFPLSGLVRWVATRPSLWYLVGRYWLAPRLRPA